MNILICNERFVFRFGVDRVLAIIARSLTVAGHRVAFMANRADIEVIQQCGEKFVLVPADQDYYNLNEYTSNWLNENWDSCLGGDFAPDIAIVGGWPFFTSIPVLRAKGVRVVFLDYGAVPLDGFEGGALITQEKLRSLRREYLPECDSIIAGSEFIATSQSTPDSKGDVPIHVVLAGADHLDMNLWSQGVDSVIKMQKSRFKASDVENLKERGNPVLLMLGRFEYGNYKNSEAAVKLIAMVRQKIAGAVLLLLANPEEITSEISVSGGVIPIGFPSDQELEAIMKVVDLGISVSLWEGFNLPLAEMQWLGKPVFVLDIGAHPEVVVNPWFLCTDISEMAANVIQWLNGDGLQSCIHESSIAQFRDFFKWERACNEVKGILFDCVLSSVQIIVDVSNSCIDSANSGVIRVTRRLCRQLQEYANPIFVIWDAQLEQYVIPNRTEYWQLGQFNGPSYLNAAWISGDSDRMTLDRILETMESKECWLIFTETMNEEKTVFIRRYARCLQLNIAAIFYDAIAVLYPALCNMEVNQNHLNYIMGLAQCDVILPISAFSNDCLSKIWEGEGIEGPLRRTCLLPGEFGGSERNEVVPSVPDQEIKILCVSTLEPRKNHIKLIESFLLVQEQHPEFSWSLNLIGNRYAGNPDIPDYVEDVSKNNSSIKWLGVVDDIVLHQQYLESTFTVYPSIVEGFGMPIMESLWHARPCICHNQGVMEEHIVDGGCLAVNTLDTQSLAQAMYALASDSILYARLASEAVSRHIKSWDEYTLDILNTLLCAPTRIRRAAFAGGRPLTDRPASISWEDILLPACLCDDWQMNQSELLGLTAVLHRHRPRISIEIGTYKGGSLSLISQYSDFVFSIDIDPSIPFKFKQFDNVGFITGPSNIVLPRLFRELKETGMSVDFILVDGDHSTDGVLRDLEIILQYVPEQPLFVMLHDSFNPGCRSGMLAASWQASPYVQWVDLDFIPGRIVEHSGGGQGELWGGLALAYLSRHPRENDLQVQQTALKMWELLKRQT